MTIDDKLDSISNQLAELVRHVAEVRGANVNLQTQFESMQTQFGSMQIQFDEQRSEMEAMRSDMKAMRTDISALDKKIDDKTDFVAGKIDHFVAVFHEESARDRTRFEEDRYARNFQQQKIEQRIDAVESRLDRLEAASS